MISIAEKHNPLLWREGPSPIAGTGLFARKPLPSGIRLLEYRGPRIRRDLLNKMPGINGETLAWLDGEWIVDGGGEDNPGRWVNHSCDPNAQLVMDRARLWIETLREVDSGAEITIDYALGAREALRWKCSCGAPSCRGFAVGEPWRAELFRELARRRSSSKSLITR